MAEERFTCPTFERMNSDAIRRKPPRSEATMRRLLDKTGATWEAEVQSRYGLGPLGQDDPLPQPSMAVVVFTGPSGRTVTADLAIGRLETIAEDDLRKVFEEALASEEAKRKRGG